MSTITKERLRECARGKVKSLEFAVTQTAFADSRSELEEELELARIALASLEAQPVSVPDVPCSMPSNLRELISEEIGILFSDDDAQAVWSVCRRAAMLQGAEPVTTAYKLQDGWVACSERMPEDEQEVITHNIFGYRHVSFFDEHSGHFFDRLDGSPVDCVEHVLVSHWMPIPAAPQQEVKP